MRTHGTLTKWNDDRGFGFISPAQGSEDLFVHVSAFPRDGERPRVTELISFETETGPDGKLRAVRIMRAGSRRNVREPRKASAAESRSRPSSVLLTLLALAAIGAYVYSRLGSTVTSGATETVMSVAPVSPAVDARCDGRTMCSQMTRAPRPHTSCSIAPIRKWMATATVNHVNSSGAISRRKPQQFIQAEAASRLGLIRRKAARETA